MNRFEQLIEYVINDEDQKARELFHDIVVAKSREIYENLMQEEAEEEVEESAEEELDEDAEEIEEGDMGGDAADDLIDDVETEEESDISMEGEDDADAEFDDEAEEAGDELTGDLEMDHDEGGEEAATKDDIMNLEDKLDQLMAEFEAAMGGDAAGTDGDGFGADEGGDAIEMDDTEEMTPGMMEAVSLKAAPKPVTSEEGGVNKKSTVAANSGQAGMASSPVKPTGTEAKGRPAPTTKDLIGDFQNKAGDSMKNPSAATKPHLSQADGVNTKSPLPGRKG